MGNAGFKSRWREKIFLASRDLDIELEKILIVED